MTLAHARKMAEMLSGLLRLFGHRAILRESENGMAAHMDRTKPYSAYPDREYEFATGLDLTPVSYLARRD